MRMEHLISEFVLIVETLLERSLSEPEMNQVLDHFNANDETFVLAVPEKRHFMWVLHPDQVTDENGVCLSDQLDPITFEVIPIS